MVCCWSFRSLSTRQHMCTSTAVPWSAVEEPCALCGKTRSAAVLHNLWHYKYCTDAFSWLKQVLNEARPGQITRLQRVQRWGETWKKGVWGLSFCWLTCLTGLSSCKNMGLEEGSSTDALATSSKTLNFSWRENKNIKSLFTNTSFSSNQSRLTVRVFKLTACKVSTRSAPVILTAISLWEATLTWHWIGRIRMLNWFCVKEPEISLRRKSYQRQIW